MQRIKLFFNAEIPIVFILYAGLPPRATSHL